MAQHTAAVEHALGLIRTDSADGLIPADGPIDSLRVLADYVDANTYLLDTVEALGLSDTLEALSALEEELEWALEQSPL